MTKKRDYSMDLLKFLASFGVVMIHVDANFRQGEFIKNTTAWDLSLAINLLSKWCVPIFIMISGYYLLNSSQDIDYNTFLKKRFKRVLLPFVVWSIIYNLYYQYISSGISIKWTVLGLIKNLLGYPTAAPLWFLYPLLGLYLMTPIFKGIVERIDFKIVAIIIGFSVLIKTISPFTDMIMGSSMNYWNDIPISSSTFAIYFILGGYLGRINIPKNLRISLYIVSSIVFIIGFIATYKLPFIYDRSLEVTLDIGAINNMLLCVSLFVMAQNIKYQNLSNSYIFTGFIGILSTVNFGVFLLHPIVIDLVKSKFLEVSGSLMGILLVQGITVYVFTSILIYIMKKTPLVKEIV